MLRIKSSILLFKMKIKNLLFVVFFFLQSCGYTPIYSELKKLDYKLNIVEIKSEPIVSNLISSKLEKISNNKTEKIIDLKVDSKTEKVILSKNRQNEITYYLLSLNITFEITAEENFEKKFNFNEEIKIKNTNDQFELKKYEDELIKNFINSKIDEFILQLSKIQ